MDLNNFANQELTSAQKEIFQVLINLTVRVSQEVIASFAKPFQMPPQEFIATEIADIREEIAQLDARTALFLEKMSDTINLHLTSLETVPQFFDLLKDFTENDQICFDLIRAKALPHIHTLIEGCDRLNPSIVDDLIYGKND